MGRGKRAARPAQEGRVEYGEEDENFVEEDWLAYCSVLATIAVPLVTAVGDAAPALNVAIALLTVHLGSRAPRYRTGGSFIGIDLRGSPLMLAFAAPVVAAAGLLGLYGAQKAGLDVAAAYTGLVCAVGLVAQDSLIQEGLAALSGRARADLRLYSASAAVAVTLAYCLSHGALHLATSNFIAWSLGLLAIRLVPLGSFPIGAVFLMGLLCYDVAFVFKSDVMVTVARGISAPVMIQNARSAGLESHPAILGLGDIIAPGAFIAFLHRFDASTKGGYARNAMVAYTVGLLTGFLANFLTQSGQPALFYVVPPLLVSALFTAVGNGELDLLAFSQEGPSAGKDISALRPGRFLARRTIPDDGMFGASVVLLLAHEHAKESLGVVVNRPLCETDRTDLLARMQAMDTWWMPTGLRLTARSARKLLAGDVRLGGPVGIGAFPLEPAVVLHKDVSVRGARVAVQGPSAEDVLLWSYLSEWDPDREVPGAILCVGLAAWQQEQLAGEVRERRWGWADALPGEVGQPQELLEVLEKSGRIQSVL